MIPLQLTLSNFLSYRAATLDFRGLHTACICGSNGAGKSSLLEAITWVIWGKSRTSTEDDIIHAGEKNVRVDFEFTCDGQTYRIIRIRQRSRSSAVEFQVKRNSNEYQSLSLKGLRNTQKQIISSLKLDYDTFINSAYLRQGRADEFMLRTASERKKILAELLKLDRYQELADRAKDESKQYKGKVELLEGSLEPLLQQLEGRKAISLQLSTVAKELAVLEEAQEKDKEQLQQLQAADHLRQTAQQQLTWQQTQYQNLTGDCHRLSLDNSSLQTQLQQLEQLLKQEPEITAGYQQLLEWQKEEESLATKFQAYQNNQQQRQELERQLIKQSNEFNLQIKQGQTRLEALAQQEKETEQVLSNAGEVEAALKKLHHHRHHLQELDCLQHQVAPLLKQRQNLGIEIQGVEAKRTAKLEQLQVQAERLTSQMTAVPEKRQALLTIDGEIGELEKKRVYQQRVEEKGRERGRFRERLQENQRVCQQQLEELRQKLQMLQAPGAACPLCEQEMEEFRRQRVIDKTQTQHQDIERQFWAIREQMATCERELQVLRGEYAQLSQELSRYDSLQNQLGQLEAQLEATGEVYSQLQQIKEEIESLERSLVVDQYSGQLEQERKQLDEAIKKLNYDEQTHALARSEVERWRWAEIKQGKIEDARRRQETIAAQKPGLLAQIASLQAKREEQEASIKQEIEQLDRKIQQLGYHRAQHNQLIAQLRQAQTWHLRQGELEQAKEKYPQLQERLQELAQLLQVRIQDKEKIQQQLDSLVAQMKEMGDNQEEIGTLDRQIQQRRRKLDELIGQQGKFQQEIAQLDNLQKQYEESCQELAEGKRQYRVYQELAQAFGKNGIQALTIENVLPQLEARSNKILARLTGNQLHVQFLTQKVSSSKSKKSAKLIDTLEIVIADAKGTRHYETYSGGEAFRINFAIRLALAQLLAQRAGTSLQMLIVDEGFGTQDGEGCERLIAAINAIAADFSCILTVTHMPQFKAAFQNRIEVYKGDNGSQLKILS